jgi:hypothetical protein
MAPEFQLQMRQGEGRRIDVGIRFAVARFMVARTSCHIW